MTDMSNKLNVSGKTMFLGDHTPKMAHDHEALARRQQVVDVYSKKLNQQMFTMATKVQPNMVGINKTNT